MGYFLVDWMNRAFEYLVEYSIKTRISSSSICKHPCFMILKFVIVEKDISLLYVVENCRRILSAFLAISRCVFDTYIQKLSNSLYLYVMSKFRLLFTSTNYFSSVSERLFVETETNKFLIQSFSCS